MSNTQAQSMTDVTRILSAIDQGDPHAAEALLPLIYGELRKLAAEKLARESPGLTLQATALVHEAYLRLVDVEKAQHWDSRGHFFAAAAEAMRRILIDQARHKQSQKRGGSRRRVELDAGAQLAAPEEHAEEDLLALDEALQQFESEDPPKARLVKLRYFAGLSLADAAAALGISAATAKRHWVYARAWLYGKIRER
jgi:RNA polymerase sigma factor (TIGR02999 family)